MNPMSLKVNITANEYNFAECCPLSPVHALSHNTYTDFPGSQLGAAVRTAQALGLHRDATPMVSSEFLSTRV